MRPLLILIAIGLTWYPLFAQDKPTFLGETETNWPGIHYQIIFAKRIPPNRLLVGVRVIATEQAPLNGTLIGFPVPIPPNVKPEQLIYYHPRPLSLASSVMVDDLSQQNFLVLSPIAPPGKSYRPGAALTVLKPGRSDILTIQFAVPPPPSESQAHAKQTLSFLFTNAKGSINNIPLPMPDTPPQ